MPKGGLIGRKGVSPVIATMLLLVITVVLAGLIMAFVLPFVRDKLGDSKECIDTLEGLEFAESRFNCYEGPGLTLETGFSIKVKKDTVKGARISLIRQDDSSDVADLKDGITISSTTGLSVRMVSVVAYSTPIQFPDQAGEQMAYISKNADNVPYVKAEISPITESGKVCEVADIVELAPCIPAGTNL